MREPCFNNLLRVLNRERPACHTMFEFSLNHRLLEQMAGYPDPKGGMQLHIDAYRNAGYDYVMIVDMEGFSRYQWPDPGSFTLSRLESYAHILLLGMRIIIYSRGGLLENVIQTTYLTTVITL